MSSENTIAEGRHNTAKEVARGAYFEKVARDFPVPSKEVAEKIGITPQAVAKARKSKPSNFYFHLVAYFSEIPYETLKSLPKTDIHKISMSVRQDIDDALKPEKLNGKVVTAFNMKGGVGKSTICALIDLPNSVILNLDQSQNADEYNAEGTTVNFAEMCEEHDIETPSEAITSLLEEGYDYVIVDTRAGSINDASMQMILDALSLSDLIIVPYIPTDRSYVPTAESILFSIEHNPDICGKWGLVANNYDSTMEEETDHSLLELGNLLKERIGEESVAFTHKIRRSGAIATLENSRMSVEALAKEKPIAYRKLRDSARRLRNKVIKALLEVS